MSQTPDPVAGSPEPEEVTAAAAADDATAAAPASQPIETPAAPTLDKNSAPEPEVQVEEVDAYVVPAGTAIVTGPSLIARLGSEVFGTFFLVLAGLGVALYANSAFATVGGGGGPLAVALAFGIAVVAGASALGHVSGGHFNPAVTVGAAIAGRTAWRDVLPYWLAQLIGGAIAAAILFVSIPSALPALVSQGAQTTTKTFFSGVSNGYGAHSPIGTASQGSVEFSLAIALLVEVVVTAVFVGIILGATDRRANNRIAPFAIGLALAVLILVAMPVTNASLNPARSTASAIFSDGWALKQLWLFWVAPIVGAALAGLVYRAFAAEPPKDDLMKEDDVYVTDEDVLVVEERRA
ncbi:aquaporin [Cellulomonas rhizosphaerae]|uniref:MIP family channel protein n=1 Tax=Cellulomonas rhizosphaerae TaxID=2293719 RepID=A0A413RQC4_9CELL|nr:aquaporin [Cellulomonas rhizosphaerae]RHA44108.1 MIP family channel protein [Cellulomonas rhizosphaerae]